MNDVNFEWDENKNKNKTNFIKHGITFEEARTVFYDENAILFDDPEHSSEEERFIILGFSLTNKLCIVCHCYRDAEETIRLISARKATKKETDTYNKYLGGELL